MNFDALTLERFLAYFGGLAIVAGALWKGLPPVLAILREWRKDKTEADRLHRTETAELLKVELNSKLDLQKLADEQIWKIMEAKDKMIAHLEDVIEQKDEEIENLEKEIIECRDDKKKRGLLVLQKLRALREIQTSVELVEIELLKHGGLIDADKKQFLGKLAVIKAQVQEYVKFLE